MKKIFLSQLLIVSVLFSLFGSVTVLADSEYTYSYGNITLKYRVENENAIITGIETYEGDIEIPNAIGEYTVTELDCKFDGCMYLMNLKLPDSITEIKSSTFKNCKNLKSVTIPGNIVRIESNAFENCPLLSDLKLSEGLKYIDSHAFLGCTALSEINIPDSVEEISQYAFVNTAYYNDKTKWKNGILYCGNYVIGVKENESGIYNVAYGTNFIGTEFRGSVFPKSITIPSTVSCIDNRAFENCISLKEISMPENLSDIGYGGFYHCCEMKSIYIPKNVKYIGKYAFANCYKLKTVYYGGTKEDWDKIEIEEENEYLKNATIVYSHKNIQADVSENGLKFDVISVNIQNGSEIIFALYNGNKLADIQTKKYNGENLQFTTDKAYTSVKITAWDSLDKMTPICEAWQ